MDRRIQEDLRKWFSPSHPEGGWKRINSKGEAIGPCAREPGEPKPKCMSNEKRAQLSKGERASAVHTKRKHDPNPERKGEPIMVSNFGKGRISEEYEIDPKDNLIESLEVLLEKNKPTSPDKWQDCVSQARAKFDVYPCVPLDSMAITRKGPAYRDQLKIGDDILTYNIQTDRLEWKPIVNLHDFEDAPLVEMKKSTGFSIRCTPNHKWVVQHGIVGDTKFINTELLETREIMDKKNHKRLVCCASMEDEASVSNLGEWAKNDSWTEKVLGMSKDQREVYLASAIVYDGHDCGVSTRISGRHTMGFSQKNEDHFWAAIFAAYLNGYHVHYTEKSSNLGMRSASIIRNKKHHSTQNVIFTAVENESVWCPETENNTWVMVQNGFITITGNSAYANGWAAQCYKRKGGKWKSIDEAKLSFMDFMDKGGLLKDIHESRSRNPATKDGFALRFGSPVNESDEKKKPFKGFVKGKNHPEGGLSRAEAKRRGIRAGIETKREAEKKGGFGKLSDKTQKRRASFCARMKGMKKHNTSPEVAADPDSKINASLRVWGCR